MLIGVFLYFLLTIVVLAIVFLPGIRSTVFTRAQAAWSSGAGAAAASSHRLAYGAVRGGASTRQAARGLAQVARRHRLALVLGAVLVAGMPLCAVLLRGVFRLDSFDPDASQAVDERVAALLQGEQLVPPPPLPPEFFTTSEIEQWQPLARSASRQWDLLDEGFRQRLLRVFKTMHDQHGIDVVLVEGWRSPERQAALAALGPSVTRAGPYESYHQHGLAADCAFLRDGHVVISERDPWAMDAYARYGEAARAVGLVWGGDWHGLRDLGHVELHANGAPKRTG
jgi:peptidoglycan L-alanyl-D-glutamate endopeptidase CwlK